MERDTKAIQSLGSENYNNIMDYIQDVTSRGTELVYTMREQWMLECFKNAGINYEDVLNNIRTICEVGNITEEQKIDAVATRVVNKFYADNNIRIMVVPNSTKEFLMKDDTPIGVWDNNIGVAVEGEQLKLTIQKWVKGEE